MMKPWLQERMGVFLPKLEGLTLADEKRIAELCAEEIEAWRARLGLKSLLSLRVPLVDARNAIRALPLTGDNVTVNRRGEPEHIALRYLLFSPEEWREMNQESEPRFQRKLQT
jgi:hypothetical protein